MKRTCRCGRPLKVDALAGGGWYWGCTVVRVYGRTAVWPGEGRHDWGIGRPRWYRG